jgi:NADPH-dependent 2,4-dienoyl-CoA reductase/sulfur reductase-like enzyme
VYMPLGTTAHKQGRVAGENMLGGRYEFQGSLGTQVVKVFDKVAARTGLREKEAIEAGFDPLTVTLTSWDHKVYYPGAKELHLSVTGDRKTGRLLGAQLISRRTPTQFETFFTPMLQKPEGFRAKAPRAKP